MDPPAQERQPHDEQSAASTTPEAGGKADPPPTDASAESREAAPAVRFASKNQEISPKTCPALVTSNEPDNTFNDVAADQLRKLHERRMSTFHFEAFSLPPSRVPSREDGLNESPGLPTSVSTSWQSPHSSPRLSALASPPLTPAGSDPLNSAERRPNKEANAAGSDSHTITPQASSTHDKSPTAAERIALPHRPASSDRQILRSSSADNSQPEPRSHRRGLFGIGAGSVPVSRESSPSRNAASHYYSKPMTPTSEPNDPYAKTRRQPQQQHPTRQSIDPRFVFSRKKPRVSPRSSKSTLSHTHKVSDDQGPSEGGQLHHSQGSMSDLKRFFRKQGHHKKRDSSPASPMKSPLKPSTKSILNSRSGPQQVPFGDDHGLTSKYGKLGRVLGSGAGGSVRLMRRKEDNTVFAVKEFRARHTYETEREYNKKVTAEFCVGSTLHHGNVIETLDILQEKGRWFEVMEYAPYDLFAIVMTGRMTREEIKCCFLQIFNGVTYLHSMGLAHRDLKLDNVVVSSHGIMKIIDFGSAHVFKYPFETGSVPAKGIVGSDPYLAPEVYESKEYDAEAVDIWSLAIIFCCMTLRRFPWKIPRLTDNSYKLFAAEPTPGHDPNHLIRPKSAGDASTTIARDFLPQDDKPKGHREHQHRPGHGHGHGHHHKRGVSESTIAPDAQPTPEQGGEASGEKKEVIKGPWRILRLLPRESRHIIHRMLSVDVESRAKMEEIMKEPWVADTVICQQLENGEVIPAEDHEHVLEPPATQPQAK